MNPLRLTLSGFKGIRDGLGKPSFTLELGDLPGLIALKGQNGRGKTTLIDNLQPYRLVPSRADGSFSTKSASFYDLVDAPVASKDLLWEHQGTRYRSLVEWKQSGKGSRSCTAFLFVCNGGLEQPFVLADGVTCDGKADLYDRAVEEVLGPAEVFFTSAFSAQGKRPISAMQPGDAKRWLGNLLNQAPLRELGARASGIAKALLRALAPIHDSANRGPELERQLTAARETAVVLRNTAAAAADTKATAEQLLVTARANLQAASTADSAQAEIEANRKRLTTQEQELRTKVRESSTALERAVADNAQQAQAAARATASLSAAQQTAKASLERPISRLTTLVGSEQQIRQRANRRTELLTAVAKRDNEEIPAARQAETTHRALQGQHRDLETGLVAKRESYKAINTGLCGIKVRIALSERVPCAGSDLNGKCELLGDARAAKAEAPEMERQLAAATEEGGKLAAEVDSLTKRLAAMPDPALTVRGLEALQREAREELRQLEGVQTQLEALNTAQADLASAREALATWQAAADKELAETNDRNARVAKEGADREIGLRATLAQHQAELEKCQREIAALPPSADAARLELQTAVTRAEAALSAARAAETEAQGKLSSNAANQSALDAQLVVALDAARRAASIEAEIEPWNLLAEAFSDRGIVALEIDAAGPTIASGANRLLADCYEARFSVELVTQVETPSGATRESFDVLVHDSRTNDTRSLAALSGGQRVWVNEAIIRSVALYLAQAGQRQYDTLFTDEVDGALDPDRKHAFMQMKLALLRMGCFKREIFITQTHELLDYADRVIDLDAIAASH